MKVNEIFDNSLPSIEEQVDMFEAYWQELVRQLENQYADKEISITYRAPHGTAIIIDKQIGIIINSSNLAKKSNPLLFIGNFLSDNKYVQMFKKKVELLHDYRTVIDIWVKQKYNNS